MKPFMNEDFLLSTETAKTLFHTYAADAPIIDYHCHLSPQEIAEDKRYRSITEVWLGGDHYKWRQMRTNGVPESIVTGDVDDFEKFTAFAAMLPKAIGNPLYHWTHLELKRYFDIEDVLTEKTAADIYARANAIVTSDAFSARQLILKSNVEAICTTDDPVDDLKYHQQLAEDDSFSVKVLPTFRPDKAINIDKATFIPWVQTLATVVGQPLNTFNDLLSALNARIEYFHAHGCRLSDHALDTVDYRTLTQDSLANAADAFTKAMAGTPLTTEEMTNYKSVVINFLGKLYNQRDWVMQIHIGALRNNSRRRLASIGPDTGFDSINDTVFAEPLSQLMDDMDDKDELPKTILYVLNPRDNYVIGTMIGNFQGGGIPGKVQFGSGWWFCDQRDGMIEQMKSLANLGLLSRFVGMLTDSRSFLSYTRHEYFRRILCNLLGDWVENGEYPYDEEALGGIVRDICINNARAYFNL